MIFESLLIEVFWGGLQILIFVSLMVELNCHDDMEGHDNNGPVWSCKNTQRNIESRLRRSPSFHLARFAFLVSVTILFLFTVFFLFSEKTALC